MRSAAPNTLLLLPYIERSVWISKPFAVTVRNSTDSPRHRRCLLYYMIGLLLTALVTGGSDILFTPNYTM